MILAQATILRTLTLLLILGLDLCHAQDPQFRDPALWPFAAEDPWNRSIGSEVRHEPITGAPTICVPEPKNSCINCLKYSIPVFMATGADPIRPVVTWYGTMHDQYNGSPRVPLSARVDSGTDKHLCIIDEGHCHVTEMQLVAFKDDGSISSWAAFRNDLRGPGFYPAIHGVRAYGGSALGGLIRSGELKNGIHHAVALATDGRNLNSRAPDGRSFVWPACSSDYEYPSSLWPAGTKKFEDWYGTTSNLYIGSLLIIPSEVNLATLGIGNCGPLYEIAKALQDYGGYLVDMAGAPLVCYLENGANAEIGDVDSLLANGGVAGLGLDTLVPHLRVVANNTPTTVGGGGTPRRPPPPPFAPSPLLR